MSAPMSAKIMLRLSLAASFLSAVADRFGLWGPPGAPAVAWGSWEGFVEYVALLNGFAPQPLIPALAWAATVLETMLAVALLMGWKLRLAALASGILLFGFALAMAIAIGVKAPLDYSVFSAAGGAFLLAAVSPSTVRDDSDALHRRA